MYNKNEEENVLEKYGRNITKTRINCQTWKYLGESDKFKHGISIDVCFENIFASSSVLENQSENIFKSAYAIMNVHEI